MNSILLVALGGALGSVARYGVGVVSLRAFGPDFPYGTMAVNIIGSTLMGFLAGYLAQQPQWSQEIRHFAMIGILGGFTTFSAFTFDIVAVYERSSYVAVILYASLSIILSLAGLLIGFLGMRAFYS